MCEENRGELPDDASLLMLCGKTKLTTGEDGAFRNPTAAAFRIDEDGLSVTWLEYFKEPPPQIEQAAQGIKSALDPRPSGALACTTVARVLELADKSGLDVTVKHDPQPGNCGHSLIQGWPTDELSLLTLSFAFNHGIWNKDIPGFV